jgi:cyclic lactone autoinducer peptide
MKSQKKFQARLAAAAKAVVEKSIALDANSTTCMIVYQPKAPAALKKFSKVEHAE